MSGLLVERSTPLVQLQDGGRFGVRHLGVTQGGALDWISHYWANWLLGNDLRAPVIEIPLGGFALLCLQDSHLALAGADLAATLDDQPLTPWRSVAVRAGQRLQFNAPRCGARAYLATPGGFAVPAVLGSCSTVSREGLGGPDGQGRALQAGDRLHWAVAAPRLRSMDNRARPDFSTPPTLELILGAQYGEFSGVSLFELFNSDWRLDSRADRMGMRLLGAPLRYQGRPMISEGIPLGAVQVPPDGQPIVLFNDRQTIGGYPRLGALSPHALARLAQCLPGETVRLRPSDQASAMHEHRRLLAQWATG
ncbi:biotin-dependent carboxyltransferase family protein [Pseudomonas sp. LS44]|uniref:5-oxoprolinase subunit C family protein n=1 Tax=Pseudomonas sp. LS44 TaxID=1357074 RepID=UPI00215A12EF|nr:biotin-dependent carboxyltransferase family protein [Pseudomonas sp. LS44]UVE16453.1 biotin-dependent carboxyltransferase family protein [Pseudomonas sp. LS44]